jgi:aminoglycoside phosphotransferase family enzyme/predicted kinase
VGAPPKDDLLRPEAYPEPHPSKIELAETHISWVFLLDREVYKVKKPVELGFLDFRSLEQRKAACEAEARLNARLSPNVYRGVVPVRRGPNGQACIGGSGPIVDFAVHMVRLPDSIRADQLLANGQLDASTLEKVAVRIASFHREAPAYSRQSPLAAPDAVAANVEENFEQTRETIGQYLRPEEHEEIVRWQRAVLRDRRALFESRVAAGRVREGHGDLRLEHVYVGDGGTIEILDCIEFNERFRVADVCADIAFLSMDLAAHGRVDLAERVVAAYAQEAGDFDLYALLDFYEGYRAYVRGKIASMMASNPAIEISARKAAREDARRYFLLALSADRRPLLSPALVAIGGVIASGKSTVAERVAAEMSAPVIDTDRTRKELLGVEPADELREGAWQGAYDPEVTDRVYREAFRRAEVVLGSGRPVVLDASFRSGRMREAARELARAMNVPFRFIECRATPEATRARLAAREHRAGVSDARLDLYESFVARFEPITELSPAEHVVLDTSAPIEESFPALRDRLYIWPPGFST